MEIPLSEKSVCTKCGCVDQPETVLAEKKNPAIGMAVGAFVLTAICLMVGYGVVRADPHSATAAIGGVTGSGCLAVIFFITGVVCIVIAIGKASSNARVHDQLVCPRCKAPGMIPTSTPVAQKFLTDHNITL